MRFALALLTVGAAGIGYSFLHQSTMPTAEAHAGPRSLFDWQSADDTLQAATEGNQSSPDDAPLVVRDTIHKARTDITSTIDEFVRVNVEAAPAKAPVDNTSEIVASSGGEAAPTTVVDQPPIQAVEVRRPEQSDSVNSGDPSDIQSAEIMAEPQAPPQVSTADEPADAIAPVVIAPSAPRATSPMPQISEATLVSPKTTPATSATPVSDPKPADVAAKQQSTLTTRTKTDLLPGKLPEKSKVFDSNWKPIAKTTNGIALHSRRVGRDGARTLIIAGLDGRDLIGVRWNDELADSLSQRSTLFPANEVQVFRAGNPDGLLKKTATNPRGVLINRNFPSRRFQILPDKSSGTSPASEVETKAILDVLYTFRPRRVIHLASTAGQSRVYYNRAAKDVAMELQKEFQIDIQPLDVELVPGSLEDFADGTLEAGVISFQLSAGPDWKQAWQKHQPMVLTAINGGAFDKMVAVSSDPGKSLVDTESSRIPETEAAAPVKKSRRGYEELPPPPQ